MKCGFRAASTASAVAAAASAAASAAATAAAAAAAAGAAAVFNKHQIKVTSKQGAVSSRQFQFS